MKLTLARTIACSDEGCQVQPLDDDGLIDAPLSPRMVEIGTRIRPGMIVALDRSTTPPLIRWRFETRPVEALTGDRMTIHGREFRFIDVRPENERAIPIHVDDMVPIVLVRRAFRAVIGRCGDDTGERGEQQWNRSFHLAPLMQTKCVHGGLYLRFSSSVRTLVRRYD